MYSSGDKDLFGESIVEKNVIDWWGSRSSSRQPPRATGVSGKIDGDAPEASDMSTGLFGGLTPNWGWNDAYSNLGKYHANRKLGNWESDNSVDIFAPAGTPIYSLSNGVVTRVATSNNGGKVYGTQISVSGKDGYPNLFYTHTDSSQVASGDQVRVGELIAYVGKPNSPEMPTHLHLGVEPGSNLESLVSRSGKILGSNKRLSSRDNLLIKKISSRA